MEGGNQMRKARALQALIVTMAAGTLMISTAGCKKQEEATPAGTEEAVKGDAPATPGEPTPTPEQQPET